MDILTAATLGIVQGLTEFLPVSSSGHLVLGQHLLGFREPNLIFDIIVHTGTLVAVLIFVRREIIGLIRAFFSLRWLNPKRAWYEDPDCRLLFMVAIGTVPTAIIGLLFKDFFTSLYASPRAVGTALIATGCILVLTRLFRPRNLDIDTVGPGRAAMVGLAQGLAIIPGISRSGSTITVGVLSGIKPNLAARFSFLLSVPAIIGALVLELLQADQQVTLAATPTAIGFFTAAISGYLALVWVMRLLVQGKFYLFAPYCWLLGLTAIFFIA